MAATFNVKARKCLWRSSMTGNGIGITARKQTWPQKENEESQKKNTIKLNVSSTQKEEERIQKTGEKMSM